MGLEMKRFPRKAELAGYLGNLGSITRLRAYADAGADVLYAPGLQSREAIQAVIEAVSPKPVNVLVSSSMGLSVSELGARRISVGSALARAAWTGFIRAAATIARDGSFTDFEGLVRYEELDNLFKTFADRGPRD